MSISEYFAIITKVLTDWHVIATMVMFLLVMRFTRFIMHYKKRPKVIKPKKAPEAEKPAAEATEAAAEESE